MLAGVEIICFAASYAVALALEVSRLLFRSGVRGAVMLGFAAAGLVAHTAFLYYRAVSTAGPPLSSAQDWYLVAAWALVVVYLYLVYYHPATAFGLFLLPLVLGLIGTAWWVADPEPFPREPASQVWGAIHGVSLALAVAALLVGFAAGLMYLYQARRLKRKLPRLSGPRLPSLEWLQQTNGRAMIVAVVMLAVGVAAGMILNLIRRSGPGDRLPWHDPFVLATLVMLVWLLLAVVVGGLYKPAARGRKVAYLTVVSFILLVLALGAGLVLNTQHGGGQPAGNGWGPTEAGPGARARLAPDVPPTLLAQEASSGTRRSVRAPAVHAPAGLCLPGGGP